MRAFIMNSFPTKTFIRPRGILELVLMGSGSTLATKMMDLATGMANGEDVTIKSFLGILDMYYDDYMNWKVPQREVVITKGKSILVYLYWTYDNSFNTGLDVLILQDIIDIRQNLANYGGVQALVDFDRFIVTAGFTHLPNVRV